MATGLPDVPAAAPFSEALHRRGQQVLRAGLALGVLALLALGWYAPGWLLAPPLLLVSAFALGYLLRHPLLHLCAAITILVFIFDKTEGIQVTEAAGGVYYVSYLAGWFLYHVAVLRERLLLHPVDYAVAFLLLFATLSLPLTVLLGGDLVAGLRQWSALLLLAFYFPIKDACARDERALYALVLTFALLALFIAGRNFFRYYLALQNAEMLWQIVQNRSRANERFLMVTLLGSLVFLTYYARTRRAQFVMLGLSVVMLAGVVVGLSRAVWLSVFLGLGVLFLVVDAKQKARLLMLGGLGAVFLVAGAAIMLDDVFGLVISGLSARFSSLETAGTRDFSLINRFYEWEAAWGHIKQSPIVGWGFGVPFPYYNLIYGITQERSYVHSTYLSVLYRHGIIGLGFVLFILGGTFLRGIRYARRADRGSLRQAVALSCVAALPALALAATTEDIMSDAEGVFLVMFPAALLAGIWQRWRGA